MKSSRDQFLSRAVVDREIEVYFVWLREREKNCRLSHAPPHSPLKSEVGTLGSRAVRTPGIDD